MKIPLNLLIVILGPAIFGLAAVGGLLAASSLLNGGATSVTVGKWKWSGKSAWKL